MAVNKSDYNKTRTNLLDVTNETYKSETNVSLIENTFNRMLTKDETVEVSGVIGDADVAIKVDRRIAETDVHRQAYQLQPLMYSKVATIDHAKSSRDIYNQLERIGVDINRLPDWGDTERFNFAPPVDLDKLINYTDYYWYDESDRYVTPQYVVIKSKCSAFTARLSQKQREISGVGESTRIFKVSAADNTISLLGDYTKSFQQGTEFDIIDSIGIDGVYKVTSVVLQDNFTVIASDPAIPSNQYGGGHIAFNTITRKLTQSKNAVCDGSAGWDSSSWDDSDRPSQNGKFIDDAMLLAYIRTESPDVFRMIANKHPEYITQLGTNINNWVIEATDARPLWSWMDQPKPEFVHRWDASNDIASSQNDWQVENKWIHKLDLPAGAIAKSTRASIPIIEYLPNLELNEWSYTAHNWMYREVPALDRFKAVDFEPTYADTLKTDFLDKWVYVGPSDPTPVNHQAENTAAKLMSVDSQDAAYKMPTYTGARVLSSTATTVSVVTGFPIVGGQQLIIHTPTSKRSYTVSTTATVNGATQITVTAPFIDVPTTGDIALIAVSNRPYNVVLFPAPLDRKTVAGQQNTRVYVDDIEQVGNYTELLNITNNAYVNGVMFDLPVSPQSQVEVGIDPSAELDKQRNLWYVRTVDFVSDQEFKEAGRPTSAICPIRYRFHQQHKQLGITKFPLFDIYHPSGDTAYRANEIFTFVIDPNATVESNIGLRIKRSNSEKVFHFKQLLTDYDNGPLYCYKDFDEVEANPSALFSIWRSSADIRYVPRYVNAEKRADGDVYYIGTNKLVAEVPAGTGAWEVPSQLAYNSSHENRVEITSSQLLEHVKTILINQKPLDGFLVNTQYGHRLLEKIDYSVGGTIREHNDSWDLLASALFATTATPSDILDFAATSYESAINAQEEFILRHAYDSLLNTTPEYITNLTESVIAAAIQSYELNDNNNRLFGDSTAFVNSKGVQSFPATAPILGLSELYNPQQIVDEKLGISEVRHHDGHYSFNRITQGATLSIAKRVVRAKVELDDGSSRFRGWTPQQAADQSGVYNHYSLIPTEKLRIADFWLSGTTLLRFEIVHIGPIQPPMNVPTGSMWLRDTDNQIMIKQSASITAWAPAQSAAGDVSIAWKPVDLTAVLNDLIIEIETRLFESAKEHKFDSLAFPKSKYVLSSSDETLYETLQERMFKEFVVSREIAYPYASAYLQTDPFTWNVAGINHQTMTWNPYADNRSLTWKGTWQGNYLEIYGTMYPHLEPWCLQGFTSKPTWWDNEYADKTGARRWKQSMWNKIIVLNDVPAAYDAPKPSTVVTVSGTRYKRMSRVYNFVPVNTTNAVIMNGSTALYGLDDLFPVFDSRLLTANQTGIINATSICRPLVKTVAGTQSVNFKASYKFGDVAAIEQEWLKSAQYVVDQLKIAFLMQPMRFMHQTWGLDYLYVGGLNVNSDTFKVPTHTETIFHGDMIDGAIYQANGINQWYSYFNRQTGVDFKVSNLRELWTGWKAKLAHQFGGFINSKSLDVRSAGADLIKEDYTIISKKSPGYQSKWIDSLNVTVANYGLSSVRNGVRVPQDDGKDWTFTVSLPAAQSRVITYYGTRRFTFDVIDEGAGIMQLKNASLPWKTGDAVYLDTSKYLPFPLDVVFQYYVTVIDAKNGTFSLSRVASGAYNGVAIELRTLGEGLQYIGEVRSTFYAYSGNRTDTAWKHHTIDKQQIIEVASPFVVQGIQGLIDVIDGYIEYKKDEGFVFNDSSEKEMDANTNRILSWQTETERAIDTIYKGLGVNNSSIRQYGSTHEVSIVNVNDDPDVFQMSTGAFPYQYADRICAFTTGILPQGLALNTTYYAIPDETDNTKFRLATTAQNAYEDIGINVTTVGSGTLSIGSFDAPASSVDDIVEVNPFRYNLWINTPSGILSDVFTGGDSANSNEVLMYDQYGRPLPKGVVMVFRKDGQAHIKVRPTVVNDVLTNNSTPTFYNLIHLGGIKAYIDGYEHVVIFEDYTVSEQMIYDAFIGMSMPRFNVEFERSENRNLRPSVGGYFMHNGDLLRNIEASIDDMRSYYQTYNVNENSDYVSYARDLLGYEDPSYLDHLNTPRKSKFLFWKGMIQQKGSRNAIRSFVNSEHFVDGKVDEFWAYKLSDFGDARPRFKPQIRLSVNDGFNNDIRLEFTDVLGGTKDQRFNQITLDNQMRWVDLPTTRRDLGGRNMVFNAKMRSFEFRSTEFLPISSAAGGGVAVVIPSHLEGIVVEQQVVVDSVLTWRVIPKTGTTNYSVLNSRVIILKNVSATQVRISGYVPDVKSLDPIELLDSKSAATIQRTKYWNPTAGNHYYVPLTSIDMLAGLDPVDYTAGKDWLDTKVGSIWVDTSTFRYVPYEDATIFPEMNDRLERWGRLASHATTKVYEWVKSSVDPQMFVDDKTTTGTPLQVWMKQNSGLEYDEVDLSPIDSWVDHQSSLSKLSSRDQALVLKVYVNGNLVDNVYNLDILKDVLSSQRTVAQQYGVKPQDYVTFVLTPPQDLLDDNTYIQEYKYITVETGTAPVYYFWVSNKMEKGSLHNATVAEIASQLTKPQVPYHVFMNFLPTANYNAPGASSSVVLPPRYTQVVVKDTASKINVDNRYSLQFTRYFNLRDDLNDGVSPLDLKNKHTEWYIFRRQQSDKIPEVLWNHVAEALVGYKLDDFDKKILTPIPSLERVVYDNTFDETSRFGLGDGQAFMDRVTGLRSVQRLIESADFNTAPVDKYEFVQTYSFDTPLNIKNALQYIFVNFSAQAVNAIFFELLMDALSDKRDYPGLFKTSWIALHGIKILETVGNVRA